MSRVEGWSIPRVTVTDAFSWGGAIRMMQVRITHGAYDHAVLLRGATVDILTVLTCDNRTYLVHVDQPRVAVGQIVRSNAAGMIDDDEAAVVAALRELAEELAISLKWDTPLNLNEMVYGVNLPEVVTPGGSDEDTTFFAVHVRVTSDDLVRLQGRTGGLTQEGEHTTIHLTEFSGRAASALPRMVVNGKRPDMKAAHSLLLYDEAMRRSTGG
ncbi:MAG TPA: NUDIX domain-containing protein [Magnetospirillaceae bacterium]|nr:NUDIX domain-containing protein [Magnetospirillaceae bacterium]